MSSTHLYTLVTYLRSKFEQNRTTGIPAIDGLTYPPTPTQLYNLVAYWNYITREHCDPWMIPCNFDQRIQARTGLGQLQKNVCTAIYNIVAMIGCKQKLILEPLLIAAYPELTYDISSGYIPMMPSEWWKQIWDKYGTKIITVNFLEKVAWLQEYKPDHVDLPALLPLAKCPIPWEKTKSVGCIFEGNDPDTVLFGPYTLHYTRFNVCFAIGYCFVNQTEPLITKGEIKPSELCNRYDDYYRVVESSGLSSDDEDEETIAELETWYTIEHEDRLLLLNPKYFTEEDLYFVCQGVIGEGFPCIPIYLNQPLNPVPSLQSIAAHTCFNTGFKAVLNNDILEILNKFTVHFLPTEGRSNPNRE